MPAPKKYIDPVITTLRLERESKKIADALHISLADSLAIGLNCQIRMRIVDDDPRVTPELIKTFKDLEAKDLSQIEAYVRVKKEEQATLDQMETLRTEARKPKEKIRVYDPDEGYIQVTRAEASRRGLV